MARRSNAETRNSRAAIASGKNLNSGKEISPDTITRLRAVAHDLSNALEAILQASYLLEQSKLDENPKRWVQLIDSSSQEAARLNRELRKLLRSLSE
jgi:K+-sensing histidine kinase KdpD